VSGTKHDEGKAALDVQQGGDHYKSMAIQPIEYVHANGIGFAEGCAIKYLSRHRSKGGAEDIRKAIHLCELLLQLEYDDRYSRPAVGGELSPAAKLGNALHEAALDEVMIKHGALDEDGDPIDDTKPPAVGGGLINGQPAVLRLNDGVTLYGIADSDLICEGDVNYRYSPNDGEDDWAIYFDGDEKHWHARCSGHEYGNPQDAYDARLETKDRF